MAKSKPKPTQPHPESAPQSAPPTFGWVPQPAAPSIDEIVAEGTYARFGVTREILTAQRKLEAHMRSFETVERAEFERRRKPWMVGPESFLGSFIGRRWKAGKPSDEPAVVG